jgi:uncharacterized membrane protein YqgA involved in biofilm formation
MIAVFVNCAVVIIGALAGVLFSKKITAAMSDIISTAAGLVTFVIGVQMALGFSNIVYLALSMILGGIVGTVLDIDKRILQFGSLLEKLITFRKKSVPAVGGLSNADAQYAAPLPENKKDFAKAFLNASVLFCVGAMSILGSLQAGIQKEYTIIFTKSVLDAFLAAVFAATLGIGTAFSAIAILIYQGSLTLLASAVARFVTDQMLGEISAAGGILLLMIGLGLTGIKPVKTANYLPSLIFIALFVLADPYITKILPL